MVIPAAIALAASLWYVLYLMQWLLESTLSEKHPKY